MYSAFCLESYRLHTDGRQRAMVGGIHPLGLVGWLLGVQKKDITSVTTCASPARKGRFATVSHTPQIKQTEAGETSPKLLSIVMSQSQGLHS
jgi:hypothetical protein